MRIGILTFGSVPNFGANLQAYSTICFLRKRGYDPILIKWEPDDFSKRISRIHNIQQNAHFDFARKYFPETTKCKTDEEICQIIIEYNIQAVIIGSDAVLQDFPLWARVRFPTRKIITIIKITSERLFPNAFWGSFINKLQHRIPVVIMSASSQNTRFRLIFGEKRKTMRKALKKLNHITVRDSWTKDMVEYLTDKTIQPNVTPDPVFAFNQNVSDFIPSMDELYKKHSLPEKYFLISFRTPKIISSIWLNEFKQEAIKKGYECVALPMPNGVNFKHNFRYEIKSPLSPLDWYSLIKNSSGYIGENMHPIIVALHNCVPIFSFDTYGNLKNFSLVCEEKSSKIFHILNEFGLTDYRCSANVRFFNPPQPLDIINKLLAFDNEKCKINSQNYYESYLNMMEEIINIFDKRNER